jgi:hypothetical protein
MLLRRRGQVVKAEVCKISIGGSIPPVASKLNRKQSTPAISRGSLLNGANHPEARWIPGEMHTSRKQMAELMEGNRALVLA